MSKDCAIATSMDLAEASLLAILQVQVTDDDIRLQGESLHDTLSRYFVAPGMNLMPKSFWDDGDWNGFQMKLKVKASSHCCRLRQEHATTLHANIRSVICPAKCNLKIVNKAFGASCNSLLLLSLSGTNTVVLSRVCEPFKQDSICHVLVLHIGLQAQKLTVVCKLLQVKGGIVECNPYMPEFPISDPIEIRVGQAHHTVTYGPYFSNTHDDNSLFPYKPTEGNLMHQKNYVVHLTTNSRVMNPKENPYFPEYHGERVDYFHHHRNTAQQLSSPLLQKLLEAMCKGRQDNADEPEQYQEFMECLDRLLVSQLIYCMLCMLPANW